MVVGLTFRQATTPQRQVVARRLASLAERLPEAVLVSTCHRVELVAVSGESFAPPTRRVIVARGVAAAERVLLVAGGLDSAIVAEEQVLGQVRTAYLTALEHGRTGALTNELFRRALRFGKRVRSSADVHADRSLADRAMAWLDERVPADSGAGTDALVVGSGVMARAMASHFAAGGARVTVASSSLDRARGLIGTLRNPARHRAVESSELRGGRLSAYDVVGVAIRSAGRRIEARQIGAARPVAFVDLSAPTCLTPTAAARLGERLLDLDRLGALGGSGGLAPDVERRFRGEARVEALHYGRWTAGRASGDGIAALRSYANEVRARHLGRLRGRAAFDPGQLAAVETMSAALVGELLHMPTTRLRGDPALAAQVRQLFGIER